MSLPQINIEELKENYYGRGMTQVELSRYYGVHRATLQKIMYRNGLNGRNCKFKKGNKSWNEGLDTEEILSHFKEGKFWQTGLTKETDERLRMSGLKTSKTKKRLYKRGELKVWCDGLTKETDIRVKKIAQKMSKTRKKLIKDGKIKMNNKIPNHSMGENYLYLIIKSYFTNAIQRHFLRADKKSRYPDIALQKFKLDIEYDEFKSHKTKEGKLDDEQRDQELLSVGWKTIRFTKKDLKDPENIIKRVYSVLDLKNKTINFKKIKKIREVYEYASSTRIYRSNEFCGDSGSNNILGLLSKKPTRLKNLVCRSCKKEFLGYGNRKFCSQECYHDSKKTKVLHHV